MRHEWFTYRAFYKFFNKTSITSIKLLNMSVTKIVENYENAFNKHHHRKPEGYNYAV